MIKNMLVCMSLNQLLVDAGQVKDQFDNTLFLAKIKEMRQNLLEDETINTSRAALKRVEGLIDGVTAAFAKSARVGMPPPLQLNECEFGEMDTNFLMDYSSAQNAASMQIGDIEKKWEYYDKQQKDYVKENKNKATTLESYAKKSLTTDCGGDTFHWDIMKDRRRKDVGLPDNGDDQQSESEDCQDNHTEKLQKKQVSNDEKTSDDATMTKKYPEKQRTERMLAELTVSRQLRLERLESFEKSVKEYGELAVEIEKKKKELMRRNGQLSIQMNVLLSDANEVKDEMDSTLFLAKIGEMKENLFGKETNNTTPVAAVRRMSGFIDGITVAYAKNGCGDALPPLKLNQLQGTDKSAHMDKSHSTSKHTQEIEKNWKQYCHGHINYVKNNEEKAKKLKNYAMKNLAGFCGGYVFYWNITQDCHHSYSHSEPHRTQQRNIDDEMKNGPE